MAINNDMRELTGREKRSIRALARGKCANYDAEYGCLPLDCECFMLGKAYAGGALCKWFRNALLPLKPEIEWVFTGGIALDTKPCAVCGKPFPLNWRQSYCSPKCARMNRRKAYAKNSKAYRDRKRRRVIN